MCYTQTTVNRAVAFGDLLLLDRMLSNGCPDVNVGDNDGNTPLIYAVSLGESDFIAVRHSFITLLLGAN